MKRYIKSSDESYDPYHGHTYRIDGGNEIKYADTPVKALQIWFQLGKKNPMDTAIMTKTRADALELCQAATSDVIEKLYERYDSCYKLEYLIDGAAQKVADGCKYFHQDKYGYGDQVYPFCYG